MSTLGWCLLIGGLGVAAVVGVWWHMLHSTRPVPADVFADDLADPLDRHIDTAAAILTPDADFAGWADDVDDWVAAGCPGVWPLPVVPGGEQS